MDEPGGNVQIVRWLFEAFRSYARGELASLEPTLRELCSSDILVGPSSALASGNVGPFRGQEEMLRVQADVAARWPDFDVIAEEYVDLPPSAVLVLGKVRARREDGSGYAVEIGWISWLRRTGSSRSTPTRASSGR
jgi:hypothetical protein